MKRSKVQYFFFLYFILIGIMLTVTPYQGDDLFYSTASQKYNIGEWIKIRYLEWSGRLLPDILSYYLLDGKVWLWRLLNPLFILLLAYSIVRIIKGEVTTKEIIIALLTFGYIHQGILSSGFIWITGSLNYLWPIAFGLFSMIPYANKVFRNKNLEASPPFLLFLSFGLLASISNEQVALCITCFSVISHLCLYFQHKQQEPKLFIITGFLAIGTLILLFAPGNEVRLESEITSWYPEFKELSFFNHLYVGIVWFFDKMFNEMRILVFTLAVITIAGYLMNSDYRKFWLFRLFSLLFAIVVAAILLGNEINLFFNFNKITTINITANLSYIWQVKFSIIIALIPYIFWAVFSILLIILVCKKSNHRLFILLCFLALIASISVMFFSPTIYASGRRVLTVGSVLFSLIIVHFLINHKVLDKRFHFWGYAIIPILNLLTMLAKWLSWGFRPFL